jgi:hypothetical protein
MRLHFFESIIKIIIIIIIIITPTYALNKIHSYAIIKLPHVSAPRCHYQAAVQNKGMWAQTRSSSYVALTQVIKISNIKTLKYTKLTTIKSHIL